MKTKRMPDGTIRYHSGGFRVTKSGQRFHPAPCRGGGHRSPHHLLTTLRLPKRCVKRAAAERRSPLPPH
jgi:hypothetical protein